MSWVWWTLGILVAIVLIVVGVGVLLPQSHVAARTIQLRHPPERVWSVLTNVRDYPSWRRGLTSVDVLPTPAGAQLAWREHTGRESLSFESREMTAPSRLVGRIADRGIPFGGTWTYELVPIANGTGTSLTITERGEVYNPLFRFISRFVVGHHKTIDDYQADLARKLDGA